MGLDWERITLGEYFEALEARNEAVSPDKPEADMARLKRFSAARATAH